MPHGNGLESLQALGKDHSDIESQISTILDILGLSNNDEQDPEIPSNHSSKLVDWKWQGHAEFALRWVLNALQTSLNARRFPPCWHLLTTLVLSLPSAVSSRSLSTAKIFSVVKDALLSIVQDANNGAAQPTQKSPAKKEKKRKRDSRENKQGNIGSGSHDVRQTEILCNLFIAIARSLHDMSKPQKRQRQGQAKARALLPRMPAEEAAELLGIWLNTLGSLTQLGPGSFDSKVVGEFVMRPMLKVWDTTVTNNAENQSINLLFSQHCLSSALSLIQQSAASRRAERVHVLKHEGFDCESTVQSIENLLNEHVFAPARRSFNDSSADGAARAQLLKQLIQHLNQDSHANGRVLPPSLRKLPIMFSMAIRHALPPRSSQKRRQSEQLWLEAVFTTLCDCGGFGPQGSVTSELASASLEDLQQLLILAKEDGVPLTSTILRQIGVSFANIGSSRTPIWSLLAAILSLDNQVFLGDPIMDDLLLDITTKSPLSPTPEQTSLGPDAGEAYDTVKNGIIIPTMRAYAGARKLKDYLRAWHMSLSQQELADPAKRAAGVPCIWEDFTLKAVLAELLDYSLITRQIMELVTEFAQNVAISELAEDSRELCFASASMIRTILYATSSEETQHALLSLSKSLFEISVPLALSDRVRSSRLYRELWRLASSTFQLWTSLAPIEEIEACPLIAARSPPLSRCGSTFSNHQDNLEVLASLSCMLESLQSRHVQSLNIEAGVMAALHCCTSPLAKAGKGAASEYSLLAIWTRFPCVQLICRKKGEKSAVSERDVLQRAVSSVLQYDRRLGSPGSDVSQVNTGDDGANPDFLRIWLPFVKAADGETRQLLLSILRDLNPSRQKVSLHPDLEVNDENRAVVLATLSYMQWRPSDLPKDIRKSVAWLGSVKKTADTTADDGSEGNFERVVQAIQRDRSNLQHWALLHRILRNSKSLRQDQFDDVLLEVHAMATKDGSSDPLWDHGDAPDPATMSSRVYQGLTELMHLLMTRHRRRFRERHQLLIMLLQSLLRCLFVARPSAIGSTIPIFALQQPTWLTCDPRQNGLQVRHAEGFNRLVTTFCDPTLSSVQRRRKETDTANLRDPTKTARMYAGQYAPYLLLSLCTFQLEGLFAQDGMREALRPGVLAMFDAMGKEVQETVHRNWEMSGAVRTLFRTWWEDWQKDRERRDA